MYTCGLDMMHMVHGYVRVCYLLVHIHSFFYFPLFQWYNFKVLYITHTLVQGAWLILFSAWWYALTLPTKLLILGIVNVNHRQYIT